MSEALVLTLSCADRPGITARVTSFLFAQGGNVLEAQQFNDQSSGAFFMRVEWSLDGFAIAFDDIAARFDTEVGSRFAMRARVRPSAHRPRVALFVSKLAHCAADLLARVESGELAVDVPVVVSNHATLADVAHRHRVNFEHVPVRRDERATAEARQRAILAQYGIELVVLARYMQILSPEFVAEWPERIINIHHSFLPAFPGARPYHQARERGVKIVGATSHYVTDQLDEGPIIAQGVVPVSHRDTAEDLVRKGRDVEKRVLAEAVRAHVGGRVLVHHGRTVVFGS